MATYWADYVNGNDANTGLSYAQAKKTWKNVLETAEAAGAGQIVNIVAPNGAGAMVIEDAGGVTLNTLAGTDYDSAPGMRIRGSDSSGTAALAFVQFADTATSVTAIQLSTGANMMDIQGLYVDWSANATTCLTKHFITVTNAAANGLRIQNCVFERGPNAYGVVLNFSSLSSDDCKFQYNVFIENANPASSPLLLGFDDRGQLDFDHNVFIVTGTIDGNLFLVNLGSNDANLTDHAVTYNTFYMHSDFAISGSFGIIVSTDAAPFSGTPSKEFRNNVVYYRSNITSNMVFADGNGSNSSANYNLSAGYNLFAYNALNSWSTAHPYEVPWDPDDADSPEGTSLWTGDEEITVSPFNDLTSTYNWGMSGAGYTVTLPYDLRIATPYRDNSSVGGVPGAIIDALVVPAPEISGDTAITINASIAAPVTAGITIHNIGDALLTISAIVLAGDAEITYGGVASDTIAAGGSATYYVTYTPTTHPDSSAATLTFTNDDSDEGTYIVTISGVASHYWVPSGPLPSTPVGPNSPAVFDNTVEGDGGIKVGLELRKNTTFALDMITAVGGYSDTATNLVVGTVEIATNSALAAVPGIQVTGLNKLMLMPEGGDASVMINAQTFLLKDGGCFLIANSTGINTVHMGNDGTVFPIKVHFFGSGGTITANSPNSVRVPPTRTVNFV